MRVDRKKLAATAARAAGVAALVGHRMGRRMLLRTDDLLCRVGDAAHRRVRRRARRSTLQRIGRLALITGAGVGVVYAGRAVIRARNHR